MDPMGEGASNHPIGELGRRIVANMFRLASDGDPEDRLDDIDGGPHLDSRPGRSGLEANPRGEHALEAKAAFVIGECIGLGYREIDRAFKGLHIAHHIRDRVGV